MNFERLSGILAHPTSFPSPFGIGDLGSGAREFIDFLSDSKQSLWQVLPIGPTSFGDSPYQSFSTFAGNPLLISPEILMEEGYLEEKDLCPMDFDTTSVDYGLVIDYKNKLFETAFKNFLKFRTFEQERSFDDFCKANSFWLDDFSLFMSLKSFFISQRKNTFESPEYKEFKSKNNKYLTNSQCDDFFYGATWSSFPEALKNHDPVAIKEWTQRLSGEIEYYKFLQYEFFRQWAEIKKYANLSGISIIGDIPIFVAMDSSDVWANPHLFFLDKDNFPTAVAGVPPDYFSETGQLWGNPLYNWDAHEKEGYDFWIKRVQNAFNCVDILRIDHFRGFEAYWSVKYGEKTAENGEWIKGPGRKLFDAIKNKLGDLPIIAEDLGDITKEVSDLREGLGLPGMKILQFGFACDPKSEYLPHNFKNTNYVVYTGTHDNDTTLGFYQSAPESIKDCFRRYMNVSGADPAGEMMRLAFSSIADYCIIPIQDCLRLDSEARMNTPGQQGDCWQFQYRSHMLTENLVEELSYLTELFNRLQVKEGDEELQEDEQ